MTLRRLSLCLLFVTLFTGLVGAQTGSSSESPLRWHRGTLHSHTINSDGDASPDEVVRWYRENGYNFVVLTDHNYITEIGTLNGLHGAQGRFLVISGEEVSDGLQDKAIHVNALGLRKLVLPQGGATVAQTCQRNVDAVRAAGGVPLINHPNFTWALSSADLVNVSNAALLEIHSGHPHVNVHGGGGQPSVESLWDDLLSQNKMFFGVAVDDSHDYKTVRPGFGAKPGQAWVMVRAGNLTEMEMLRALQAGDFYSSTGVELTDYKVTGDSITIDIREQKGSKYTVKFIGAKGQVLAEAFSTRAVYKFRGDELYVRAKILESNGKVAWTQPVFLAGSRR